MIRLLAVENIAVLEKASLELDPGLTAFTGETGAGKSLLIDAIALALGDRADSDLVRTGKTRGSVLLTLDGDSERIEIQRDVSLEGRSTARINGRLVSVADLRASARNSVEIHGQQDHFALGDPVQHLGFLDAWLDESASKLFESVAAAYKRWHETSELLQRMRTSGLERARQLELLRHQVNEIASVELRPGELEQVGQAISRLHHMDELIDAAQMGLQALRGEEPSVLGGLGVVVARLESAAKGDEQLQPIVEAMRSAYYELDEATAELRHYEDRLENDPDELNRLLERQDVVRSLLRKYGESEEEVLAFLERASEELRQLEEHEWDVDSLTLELEKRTRDLEKVSGELSLLRKEAALSFSSSLESELRELAIPAAVFQVQFTEVGFGPRGNDEVCFLFSANKGEDPKPLHKAASGGEMSRVMLAMKVILAGKTGHRTLIFDEIDTGLSGKAAAVMARKLHELSQFYQVIAITHLPHLAGRADHHILIEKVEQNGRTSTILRKLDGNERVNEVARMFSGEEVGDSARAYAEELLAR